MTITTADVHIKKSEVMSDTDSGGGHMTGVEVVDGELNNVFDDTSRTDRVNGRVSLRKVFGCALTSTVDKFLGAHAIITRPPADGRVSALILDLDSHSDHRSDAQAAVEAYLLASVETQMTLYSNQPKGARSIIAYQEQTAPTPAINDVLCLSVESVADANFGTQQFVRITSLASEVITAYDSQGVYLKAQLTMGISEKLEVTFSGTDLARQPTLASKPTRIRKTDLNPSARYYGIVPLAEDITAGDLALKVNTILQPVVPASYAEAPLLDQQVGASTGPLIAAGGTISETYSKTGVGGAIAIQLVRPSLPGSVTVTATAGGGGANDAVLGEVGSGVLVRSSGGVSVPNAAGTVASVSGQVNLSGIANVAYTVVVSYTPAAAVADVQNTDSTAITLSNRGFNYSKTLTPKPAIGSVIVEYRALNQWYSLVDAGDGTLSGADGIGTGTINYLTGTVNVTCGYQPDVGSAVLFGWGTGAHVTQALTSSEVGLSINATLGTDAGLVPGSVDISWVVSGVTKHATDSAAHGLLAGDGTGTVDYGTGSFTMVPNTLIGSGTTFNVSGAKKGYHTETPSVATSGSNKTFTVSTAPVVADTVKVVALYKNVNGTGFQVAFRASGSAFAQITGVGASAPGIIPNASALGSVNNTSGACAIPVTLAGAERYYTYSSITGLWTPATRDVTFDSIVSVTYTDDGGSASSVATSFISSTLRLDFSRAIYSAFVPGSLIFTLAGRRYYENSGSLYYRDGSNVEQLAGSFDTSSGIGSITSWASGSSTLAVLALLAKIGVWKMGSVTWRTAGAPIRSTSFVVTDGTHTATADVTGALTGGSTYITGSINIDTGVYSVTFAPAIVPELARYNAVALTYLPIDPEILGLNAVRLPLDGQVPIFASGYDLVILNDQTDTLTNPVIAGSTYSLSRGQLNSVQVYDVNGLKVTTDKYTVNLVAGSITMANPLDLSAYVQPLTVEHRIEDMVLCVDAQLSGDVQVSGYISHDFPTSGTYVASAKLFGDLQASVDTLFSQTAWTGVWQDTVIGTPPTAQYNAVTYPFLLRNDGAVTERWRIEFTNANSYRLIGETFGVVDTGSTLADFSPTNPATGHPYFTIDKDGWGSGWNGGNQLRFNTHANAAPIWLLRCTLQGPATDPTDQFRLQFRGDN